MTEQPPLPNLPQPPDPPPDKEPGTDGVLRRPEPSWRVLDADDLLSRSIVASNQLHIQIARACTPAMTDVIDDVLSRLAVRLGLTEYKASRYVEIGFMLQNYPQLAAFLEQGQFPMITSIGWPMRWPVCLKINVLRWRSICWPSSSLDGLIRWCRLRPKFVGMPKVSSSGFIRRRVRRTTHHSHHHRVLRISSRSCRGMRRKTRSRISTSSSTRPIRPS